MSQTSTHPPSGMRDFLPETLERRRHAIGIIERVYESYGFVPVETPSMENLEVLLGKYGEEGDQLIFRVLKRRDSLRRALEGPEVNERDLADLALRYDLTVPLARVVAHYRELPRFFKRYQIQPVWRADRPGHGRFREFYQCDVDVIGTESILAEAEVTGAVAQVLLELGFTDFTIEVNDRRVLRELIAAASIHPEQETTALIALDKMDRVGLGGVLEELEGRGIPRASGERLLELIQLQPGETDAALAARLSRELGSQPAVEAFRALSLLLELSQETPAADRLRLNPALARGLGYYTGPIFEIRVRDLAGSLGGGGRYDDLIGIFGRGRVPAVGFSLGLERILLVMEERSMYPDLRTGPDILLAWVGVDECTVLEVAHYLRRQSIRVEVYPQPAKLGKQLQYADSPGVKARVVAILGEEELATGTLTLKRMATGAQERLPLDEVRGFLSRL